jgi:hypothetical protein
MNLDNITDINFLKDKLKGFMAKVKVDIDNEMGYVFKQEEYYFLEQDQDCIQLFSDDYEHSCYLTYDEASKHLYK